MSVERMPEHSEDSELQEPIELIGELNRDLAEFGKHLNRLRDLSPELTYAWQAVLRTRDALESSLRAQGIV